ncbi:MULTISPECIES: YciI family protein [unclassified Amycolatopsis]|uniref:YciI family protein n=1 Tax=unclassified Amycolatopsis TaxID=2618356 RepID=UPI002E0D5A24|nr:MULTISPECIES: YciI family protein [unclassified Amycolatopsis]WSJ74518.1 YciI family protein [Amycolatopsis sp. NBC_01307]WSK81830.1 YciI family protein [Amycolatopsis sp. NBC_01286]
MRFMVIVKASEEFEGGQGPSAELLEEMAKFNEEMLKAGILLAGEGLTPSSQGARIVFSGKEEPKVVDGPFAETKELVGGFWILQVRNREEAVEWIKRMPNTDGSTHEVEIRRVAEASDFDNLSPEVAEIEAQLRAKTSGEA